MLLVQVFAHRRVPHSMANLMSNTNSHRQYAAATAAPGHAPVTPLVSQQPPSFSTGKAACRSPVKPLPPQQQQQQDVQQPRQPLHHAHHTAYAFVAPNWEPLVGCSKQHLRVEKEVGMCHNGLHSLTVQGIWPMCVVTMHTE